MKNYELVDNLVEAINQSYDIQDYYSVSFVLATITDDEYYFNVNFSNCLFTYKIKKYVDIRNSDK